MHVKAANASSVVVQLLRLLPASYSSCVQYFDKEENMILLPLFHYTLPFFWFDPFFPEDADATILTAWY